MGTSLIPLKDRVSAMVHGAKTKGLDSTALWNLLNRNNDAPKGDAAKAALLQEAGIVTIDGKLYHPSFAPKSEEEKRKEKANSIVQSAGALGVDRSYFWRQMRRDKLGLDGIEARIAFVQKMGFVLNPADGRIYHPDFVPAGGFPPAAKPEGSPSPGDEDGDDDGDDETGKPASDHPTIIREFVRNKGAEGINKGYFRAALRQKGIAPAERYGWQALFDAAGLVESPDGQLFVPEFAPVGLRVQSGPIPGDIPTPPVDDDDDETFRDRGPDAVKDTGLGGKPHDRDVIWRPGQGKSVFDDDLFEEDEPVDIPVSDAEAVDDTTSTFERSDEDLTQFGEGATDKSESTTSQAESGARSQQETQPRLTEIFALRALQTALGLNQILIENALAMPSEEEQPAGEVVDMRLNGGEITFTDGRGRKNGTFKGIARIVVYFEPEVDEATSE